MVVNARNALAIEIMTAAAGLDQRSPLAPSKGVAACHAAVRAKVAPLIEDRPLYRDIATIAEMIARGTLTDAARRSVGALR